MPYCSNNCETEMAAGFTVVELLVASTLGLLVVGLSLLAVLSNRDLYKHDVVTTRLNQNIRGAIDLMALNVRQAGEALDSNFPAVEVINGSSGAPDELIIRRNLFENEILNVCQAIVAGTSTASVMFAYNTTSSACDYDTALQPYLTTWTEYLTEQGTSSTPAYIFDRVAKVGEFFPFTGGLDTGTEMYVLRGTGNWGNSYQGDGSSAAMYLIEEYDFRLQDGLLQLIENDDLANVLNVVDGITDFQVTVRLQDGTTRTSFGASDDWSTILSLEVFMGAQDTFSGTPVSSSVTSRLFPRNVLSQ